MVQDAALRLFAEHGYDATSVDDIASAVGMSRSTFFRVLGSKEAAVFSDHDGVLRQVEQHLRNTTGDDAVAAVTDAVKLVLRHFVLEGDRALARYQLTSQVPALRDRELVSSARYQRMFRRHLSNHGDGSEAAELRAEMFAAAVVAAHNHVLRRWLRGDATDPEREMERALAAVHSAHQSSSVTGPPAVIVVPAGTHMEAVERTVRQTLGEMAAQAVGD
jgi:AcrR family transcriptional regulator